jgi:predicted DNA-binding protein (MmcQ/YjbR family)
MNKKHWISINTFGNISNDMIKQLITDSYYLVVKSLPKKIQKSTLISVI